MVEPNLVVEVRELLNRVPRAPEQPFPEGADDHALAELTGRLGQPLPGDVAAWLRICCGEAIGPGGVFGARPDRPDLDIAHRRADHPGWIRQRWLPVAGDGCGNAYVLVEQGPWGGYVGFVDTLAAPDGLDHLVASDLWHFLRFLFGRELGATGWPFQAAVVLASDPELARAPAYLLPWGNDQSTH